MPLVRAELKRKHHHFCDVLNHDISQVLYLPFDYDDGNYARDRSGYNNHGNIYGAVHVAGKIGDALSFNGTDSYVEAPNTSDLINGKTVGTIMAWVWNPGKRVDAHRGLIGWRDDVDTDFYLVHLRDSDLIEARIRTPSGHWELYPSFANYYGQWVHVAFVRDGNTSAVYFNGVKVASRSDISGTWGSSINFRVGHQNYPSFDGLIDEVRAYNRALSQAEIKRIMNMRGL